MRTAALFVLLPCLASASTGGDQYVNGLCLEPSGKRIFYMQGDYSEGGFSDGLTAIDVATGKRSEVIPQGPADDQAPSEPLLEGCRYLMPAKLSEVGLSAETRLVPMKLSFEARTLPEDVFVFRPMQSYSLTVSSKTGKVGSLDFVSCYGNTPPVKVVAYHLPGHRFVALAVATPGQCYGGGTYLATVVLLKDVLGAKAKLPEREAEQAEAAETMVPITAPEYPYERLVNDAGMTLYRAGKVEASAGYFETAYDAGRYAKRPYPLAKYNQAAALAKAGKTKEALEALAVLLSFRKEQARYRAKVRADADFKALWGTPELEALLTNDDCCLHFVREYERSVSEWRWREGESVFVREVPRQ